MVTIGFIVEGDTEKIVIESESFKTWAKQQGINICQPVLDAKGGGNLLPENIEPLIRLLKSKNPDHIVILTDLEHESNPEQVRKRIGRQPELIFIAVKAIEAWFLADSVALSNWLKTKVFEEYPEATAAMPWERLRELAEQLNQKGTGSNKPRFAQRMTQHYGFELARAAHHPRCPSAKEFHDGLIGLAK